MMNMEATHKFITKWKGKRLGISLKRSSSQVKVINGNATLVLSCNKGNCHQDRRNNCVYLFKLVPMDSPSDFECIIHAEVKSGAYTISLTLCV